MSTKDHKFYIPEYQRLLSILKDRQALSYNVVAVKEEELQHMLPMLDPNYDFKASRSQDWTPGNTRYSNSAKGNLSELICLAECTRLYGAENIIDLHNDRYLNSTLSTDFIITKWKFPVLVQCKSSTRSRQYGIYVHKDWFDILKKINLIHEKLPGAYVRLAVVDYEDRIVALKDAYELTELFVKYTKDNESARIPFDEWKKNRGIVNDVVWYQPVDNM